MKTLASDRYAPITSAIGFLEAPLDQVAKALESWRGVRNPRVRTSRLAEPFPEVLHRLEPLTGGTRPRELLVTAGPSWTAYFDCGLRGTDAVSTIGHLSETMAVQGLAVRCKAHTVGMPGTRHGHSGSVQFELFGPLPTDFMNYVRIVTVTHTGSKWQFDADGTVQAFEETEAYEARKIRDRFTSEMLERYCRALGIEVFDPASYGPDSVLVETDLPPAPGGHVMSLAEVQEWLDIVPGLAEDMPG